MKKAGGGFGRGGGGFEIRFFEPLKACSVVDWIVSSPMFSEHTFSTYLLTYIWNVTNTSTDVHIGYRK